MTSEASSSGSRSLWTALHDGRIVEIVSDLMARTLTIAVLSPHLAEHAGLPDTARLRLLFERVRSVHASTFRHWPGECESQTGKTWAEKESIVAAYQAKGREETVSWDEVERTAATVDDLHILEAELDQAEDLTTVSMSCHTSDAWFGIRVTAGVFGIDGTDGFPEGMEAVVALGEGYWKAFGSDSR